MDLGLLSIFVAVADASSFSKAAAKLGTATATVSRGIAKLEELAGAELILRTTRRVSLSTAGAALYKRTAPHVGALREAVKDLPEHQEEPAGFLRVTAPYEIGITFLADLSARFTAMYPKVRLEAVLTDRNVDLVAEGFDLAVRGDVSAPKRDSSLVVHRLMRRAPLALYASPAYLARRGVPRVPWAKEHDWIVSRVLHRFVPGLPKDFEARLIANDFLFVGRAARVGAGVALLPTFFADPYVEQGELVRVLAGARLVTVGLVLAYPSSRPLTRKVVAFRDLVMEAFKGDPVVMLR